MGRQHILEPAAQEIADATSRLPPVDELGPDGLRKALDDVQAAPIAAPEVDARWITVAAEVGEVRVRIVKPVGSAAPLPSVLYIHGGGWVRGNAATHDRLVRELAVGVNAAHLALAGLRRGEISGLRWSDVQLDDSHDAGTLAIAHNRVSVGGHVHDTDPKTARSARTLPLTPALAKALKRAKAIQAAERLRSGPHYVGQGST